MESMGSLRSFREGEVSRGELEEAADCFHNEYPANQVRHLAEQIDSLHGDIFICDGDLTLDGDLDLLKPRTLFLWIKGQLRVRGGFFDYYDPETLTLVGGRMEADRVITGGWLNVMGDLVVNGPLVGSYNDCSAYIGGSLQCRFFYPENHLFDVAGRAEIDHGVFVGSSLKASDRVIRKTNEEVALLLSRDLVDISIDFDLDEDAMHQWLRQGRDLFQKDE